MYKIDPHFLSKISRLSFRCALWDQRFPRYGDLRSCAQWEIFEKKFHYPHGQWSPIPSYRSISQKLWNCDPNNHTSENQNILFSNISPGLYSNFAVSKLNIFFLILILLTSKMYQMVYKSTFIHAEKRKRYKI